MEETIVGETATERAIDEEVEPWEGVVVDSISE